MNKEDFLTCYGDILVHLSQVEDGVAYYVSRLEEGIILAVSATVDKGRTYNRVEQIGELRPDAGCAISPDGRAINFFN